MSVSHAVAASPGNVEPIAALGTPWDSSARSAACATACDLLAPDEIASAINGTWPTSELTTYPHDKGSRCEWMSRNGSILALDMSPATTYDPEGWGADEMLDGLGEQAYRVTRGWDRLIGFVRGGLSVMLVIDYTKVDPDGFLLLARLVHDRLGEG